MNRTIIRTFVLLALTILLGSWGWSGHKKINKKSTLSFPFEMNSFTVWADSLAAHASDADDRKYTDSTESPKHYIDIDDYSEFVGTGRIPSTLDSAIMIHGSYFVYNTGILPWATMVTFDSLKNAFIRHDWHKAMLFASDLGHYVADGHMPLHICANYDGQLTGQDGIHSRYESDMIWYYIGQISITGQAVHYVPDVNQYVFNYIYSNFQYVDTVLMADTYALALAGNDTSTVYYDALWAKTSNCTKILFQHAAVSLADLIYTAWYEAGSPINGSQLGIEGTEKKNTIINYAYPDASTNEIKFSMNLKAGTSYDVSLFDISGKKIGSTRFDASCDEKFASSINTGHLSGGIYYLNVRAEGQTESLKIPVL
ncbi:MAG: T9SS type A sorting domain-containing protein [Bacteroidota bacterium]